MEPARSGRRYRAFIARSRLFRDDRRHSSNAKTTLAPYVSVRTFGMD
ncbi:MAG TPA: hypothetical protein VF086_10765 [Propionibacteriaceae bacterium]